MTEYNLNVMMACGCKANSIGSQAGSDKKGPACVIHNCFTVAEEQPDLTGRKARCAFYGKQTRRSECLYKGDVKENGVMICRCERDSALDLPFFKYMGPGSPSAALDCKHCHYHWIAHQPRFEYVLKFTRDWYKHKKIEQERTNHKHMPDRETFDQWLEKDITRMIEASKRPMFPSKEPSKTVIYKIDIVSVTELPSGRDHEFEPHGPYEFDEFYCGCHSWD